MRVWIGIALMVSTLITEAHSFFAWLYPKEAWIDTRKWFTKPPDFAVSLQWWIKSMGDSIHICTLYLIIFVLGYRYSKRVCWMAAVNFLYFVIDYNIFFYNYKISYQVYWAMAIFNLVFIILILIPEKKLVSGEGKVIEL